MTNEEKLKSAFNVVVKYGFCSDCRWIFDSEECHEFDCYQNGVAIIKQALEKQIPKKPNKAIDSSWGIKKEVHVCPICDYYLTEVHFIAPQKIEPNKKITYCETCGQAIDWSDEE